jgi:hypothetical protein
MLALKEEQTEVIDKIHQIKDKDQQNTENEVDMLGEH